MVSNNILAFFCRLIKFCFIIVYTNVCASKVTIVAYIVLLVQYFENVTIVAYIVLLVQYFENVTIVAYVGLRVK